MFTEQELKEFWKVKKSIEWNTVPKPPGEHYKDLQGNCWICTSHAKGSTGRPHINHRSHGEQEHIHISRLMYERAFGEIPAGFDVLHKCDRKDCVNPHHLYLGTDIDNTRDRMERGQQYTPQGEGHGKAKLTNEQILEIYVLKGKMTSEQVGKLYNYDPGSVRKIWGGKRWKHITQQHKH